MPNLGRKPNVMPILDETNIEALLKLKSTLEQSIESKEAQTNLGNTLEKLLKHCFSGIYVGFKWSTVTALIRTDDFWNQHEIKFLIV